MLDNDDPNRGDLSPSSFAAEDAPNGFDAGLDDNLPLSDPKGEAVLPSLFVVIDPPNGFDAALVVGVVLPESDVPKGEV